MLKPPAWAKNAIPTSRGWVNPKTGELLVSRKLSDRQITEYLMVNEQVTPQEPLVEVVPLIEADPVIEESAPTAEPLIEADPVDLSSMTKVQLEEYAMSAYNEVVSANNLNKSEMISMIEEFQYS
jgi:hypothetical protein